MQESTSREKVLKKVRKALIQKSLVEQGDVDFESNIYTTSDEPLEIQFAQRFAALNGNFIFCENEEEFSHIMAALVKEHSWNNITTYDEKVQQLLKTADVPFISDPKKITSTDVGVTLCECLVARTGSVFVTSRQPAGRRLPVYSNIHVVVAYTSQLVYNLKDALTLIKGKYNSIPSMIANITGPSRTADIEKTLVQGAHGPKEIFVCLIDDTVIE
jgi:L-lactate dehydrogenase complex protein LldG